MIRPLFQVLLLTSTLLTAQEVAKQPVLSKAQELSQSRDLIARLSASTRKSQRPVVGVLNYWEVRINTYSDDADQQLERSALYPLYYKCCQTLERLYKGKLTTYLLKDVLGYPSQITIVNFEDEDLGKSHLIVGLWEGNDSTGFNFIHLPGSFDLKEGWKKRESWDLKGIFFNAESPAEQAGADQTATASESKSEGKDKPQPESKNAPR